MTAERLSRTSPALRADIANRALDALATSRTDNPTHAQTLAHLVSTYRLTRDAVIAHAIRDATRQDRVDALVRTFRAAPTAQQPKLAAAALVATYIAGWQPAVLVTLAKHADPNDGLKHLFANAINERVAPDHLRRVLVDALDTTMTAADDLWTAQRSTSGTRAIDRPDTRSRPSGGRPEHGPDRPIGRGPGGRDLT
ncbi:hypothetical protein [Myceligenerans indicum]|uniref:DUF222 domain-containing protein n=1 Tax=Myceligenerans indicum TaxID=2593663 RepID=A0ABS1LR87_9MICO|nr:hypothetical protein [Myceligenerans indicum]MBL0888792.1 hypothetical protein [Myceligenerans indicum]